MITSAGSPVICPRSLNGTPQNHAVRKSTFCILGSSGFWWAVKPAADILGHGCTFQLSSVVRICADTFIPTYPVCTEWSAQSVASAARFWRCCIYMVEFSPPNYDAATASMTDWRQRRRLAHASESAVTTVYSSRHESVYYGFLNLCSECIFEESHVTELVKTFFSLHHLMFIVNIISLSQTIPGTVK